MEYYTTAELAKKWGITQRRVAIYCKEGRFEGENLAYPGQCRETG